MFRGFSPDMLPFMAELAARNDKRWYDDHKPLYRSLVVEPFTLLAEELAPAVRAIDPRMITEPRRCLSRARRDTRFTKDKSLYRSNIWLTFRPATDRWECPMYYFEVLQDKFRVGLVYGWASPAYMRSLRNYIADCPNDFRQGLREIAAGGLVPCGETYKKPKPDAPKGLEEWFSLREAWFNRDWTDLGLLQGREFVPAVRNAIEASKHMYEIFRDAPDWQS